MKRKVLILPSWYPSKASPVSGIFIEEQARVLLRDYDVAVLFPAVYGWWQFKQWHRAEKCGVEEQHGIKLFREQAFVPFPKVLKIIYRSYVYAARQGFKKILTHWGKPDIIHAHVVLPGGWAATLLGREYDIPVILTEHSSPFSVHLKTEYQRRLVRETIVALEHVVAVSPSLAQQISVFQITTHISVVGNLVRTDFFEPLKSDRRRSTTITRFLSVGQMTEQKGLIYLLEAVRLLLQKGITSLEVVIGGHGRDRTKLEAMVQALGLSDRFHFLGLLGRSEVRDWMQRCDVFVLPSLHETFGIVLGEAMACGKPVISTRCGGPEFVVVPETGLLIDKANPSALANAMEAFILGRFKYDSGLIRKSIVERFGEEAFLQNISKIYEEVWAKA